MSISTILASVAAEVAEHHEADMLMPPPMFGVLALILFTILGVTVFAYRDVANRHSQKPAAQPGAGASGHGH